MRYSAHLRTARQPHILKNRFASGAISVAWFLAAFAVLVIFVNFSSLDPYQIFVGFLVSLWRTGAAYIVSLVLSIILALVITTNRAVENVLLPVFDVLQSFPSFALFPVLVHALQGSPEIVIISVLIITMLWPILFTLIAAIKNRREDLEEAATVFGATGWRRLTTFTLPALRPALVTGSIVGWGEGWEFIIGAELLVKVPTGIGAYLGRLGDAGQNGLLSLGIVFLMLFLYIVNRLIWLPLLHRSTQYESES